jgi:ABC-type enterochelin transport system substrate-binding protein
MEQLKLLNGTVYDLVAGGVRESDETLILVFLPGTKTFEQVEKDFAVESNVEKVYILGADGEPMKTILGYTQYKGMAKQLDYVISSETVNNGTEDEPDYETVNHNGTVMIMTLSKPDLQQKYKDLEETVEFLVAGQLGA